MTLRTDEDLELALTTLAKAEGISKQDVVRRAVMDRYHRSGHAARVKESADRGIKRWADVLDRLGSV